MSLVGGTGGEKKITGGEAVMSEAIFPASVEVNGESVGVTFDGTASLVNGQPVIATAEESTVEINGEEVSVTFDGTDVIVNGEAVSVSETVGGRAPSTVVEAKLIDVNRESASVIFDRKTAIVNGEVLTASEEGSTVMIDRGVADTSYW